MDERLKEIERRLEAVSKDPQTFTRDENYSTVDCPLCSECPLWGGDKFDCDTAVYDFDAYAAGIQAFGIGADLKAFEEFIENARQDMAYLLGLVEGYKDVTKVLMKPYAPTA